MTTPLKPAVLTGIFVWDVSERHSDRYGAFTLDKRGAFHGAAKPTADKKALQALEGRRVKVVAKILEASHKDAMLKWAEAVGTTLPNVGDAVVVGVGTLKIEPLTWPAIKLAVALVPNDGRTEDWLDPVTFNRLHDQYVEITVAETDEDFSPVPAQEE